MNTNSSAASTAPNPPGKATEYMTTAAAESLPGRSLEQRTSLDNAGVADWNATAELPDFAHYHSRGILPAIPAEVAAAFAEHHRIATDYRRATTARGVAQQTVDAGQANLSRVITEAALAGRDPGEAEAKVRADLAQARTVLSDSAGVRLGYIKATHAAANTAMIAAQDWAPDVHAHLDGPIDKAAKLVAQTRQAYEQALAAHRELEAVSQWFAEVEPGPGATWPNAFGVKTTDPDDDHETA